MSDVEAPITAVREVVARALAEDLGPLGDLTAALLPEGTVSSASFVPRDDGVLAGRGCVTETFAQIDPAVRVEWSVEDGEEIRSGQVLAVVEGPLASILTGERTALNLLCHLSGIASLTRRYVRATHGNARIRDTRKTTPGLRALEKAAVRAGGGTNHRGNLSDGILVKDNHLGGMAITQVVSRARLRWPGRVVEVECDTMDQVREAVRAGVDIVMCDNMSPADVAVAVAEVDKRALVEVSGGITLDTVSAYADAGADLISVGSITHSAPILDIGLDER
jgi:nicotinate-nucleotide pyrophosphorylase (carboxylating)